jgi:hypothetical protein
MIDEQIENWIRKMQTACNRSALDSDINIIKLIQHIEDLYEQGRADEREACAKLCLEPIHYGQVQNNNSTVGGNKYVRDKTAQECAYLIRARG